jgi:hypothetical protein
MESRYTVGPATVSGKDHKMHMLASRRGHRALLLLIAGVASVALFSCAPGSPPSEEAPANDEAPQSTAAKTAEKVGEKIDEATEAVRSFAYSQKEELGSWAHARLDEIQVQLNQLDSEISEMDESSAEAWQSTKSDFEKRAKELSEQIDATMKASADDWNEASSSVLAALRDFGKSVGDAVKEAAQ